MNNSSNPIMNRLSSMPGRSPPSPHSPPSPADKYINYHQSNSFFLPKDWESRNYEENLHYALKTTFGGGSCDPNGILHQSLANGHGNAIPILSLYCDRSCPQQLLAGFSTFA
ncbi:hypothetical protein G6F68_018465 [Rhizopus microsporus]|nr:hypothetical protein G6F68_018465 [Rhizopus microsporus]